MAGVAGSKWLREEDALAAIESLANRFRVDDFTFAGSSTEVRVTCLEHGLSYRQTIKRLVAGTVACPRCRGRFGSSADLRSYLEDRYGDGYDFSTVDYRGLTKPVAFSCRTHGELTVTPQRLMRGQACRTCEHGISTGDFIRRADELYGVGFYDYSKVSYRIGADRVTVGCPIHGDFQQTVVELLRGRGCQKCGRDWGMGFEGFLERARAVHGDRYGYDEDSWLPKERKLRIHCQTHGWFHQLRQNHMAGSGCPECAVDESRLTADDIRARVGRIHGEKYLLHLEGYSRSSQPIPVECVDHGYRAEVNVGNLLAGQGMLCCSLQSSRSAGEIELGRWILERHPDALFNHRGLVGRMELDVYVPSLLVAVEYNGDYWHSEAFIQQKLGMTATQRHQQKLQAARQSHVDLLYVWETDWRHRRTEVEQALADYLTWIEAGREGDPPPTEKLLKKLTNG